MKKIRQRKRDSFIEKGEEPDRNEKDLAKIDKEKNPIEMKKKNR